MEEKTAPFKGISYRVLLGKSAVIEASGALLAMRRGLPCCSLNLDSDARLILRR